MNKFLWNLFGIKEGDVPDPTDFVDPTRRGFLKMLGGATIVGVAAPKHFLAPVGGWPELIGPAWVPFRQPVVTSLADLIVPSLTDNVFKPSPLFINLTYPSKIHHRRSIKQTVVDSAYGGFDLL